MRYHHCLVPFIGTIVLLTIVHDVTGSGLFDDDVTTPKMTTRAPSSASSFQISWLIFSSAFVIVIGLIKSYTESTIF
ncbi:unnamed protein product [Schistosoma spindalis]|nr:unnamed protein product [Schistosoma spindale]